MKQTAARTPQIGEETRKMTKAHFHHAPLHHLVNERATISAKENSNPKMALFVRHPIRRQNAVPPPHQ